jgi:hypothetical protein
MTTSKAKFVSDDKGEPIVGLSSQPYKGGRTRYYATWSIDKRRFWLGFHRRNAIMLFTEWAKLAAKRDARYRLEKVPYLEPVKTLSSRLVTPAELRRKSKIKAAELLRSLPVPLDEIDGPSKA